VKPLEPPTHPEIEAALEQLRVTIRRTVRAEQLVDQLTKLSNDDALNEWIQSQIEVGNDFWLAFVEVDRFKSVNDEFGYDDADVLLCRIAGQLKNAATNFFTTQATPFRAHGDEFFVGGPGDGAGVPEALEQIRTSMASLRVKAESKLKPMSCTVSIGWATLRDAQTSGEDATKRSLRGILETAVAEAKRKRNQVVRYAASMEKRSAREGRADCGGCRARFTVSIPIENTGVEELYCPSCGQRVERPVSLRIAERA
jgi:diguanylate cyclase (GGDEF)-like protein